MMKLITVSALLLLIALSTQVDAWPAASYPRLFQDARRPLPPALSAFLKDFEPVLMSTCRPVQVEQAVQKAIELLTTKNLDPRESVAAIRDAGCAAAEMSD